jgi:DNA-binding Lrp family transcriptional regulator
MTKETDITAGKHGRNEQSETAFGRIRPHLARSRERVLAVIRSCGQEGATTAEIAEKLNCAPNDISGRMSELKATGAIFQSRHQPTRISARGRWGAVYVASLHSHGGSACEVQAAAAPGVGRLPLPSAESLSQQICGALADACVRVAIGGPVRERQMFVDRLEVVALPEFYTDLFGNRCGSRLDKRLSELVAEGRLKTTGIDLRYELGKIPGMMVDIAVAETESDFWSRLG